MNYFQIIDNYFENLMLLLRNPLLNKLMIFITSLGNIALVWILILLWLQRKHFNLTIIKNITIIFLTNTLIVEVIKRIVKRPRPYTTDIITNLISIQNSYSFPSGHAASSFVMATLLSYYYKQYSLYFYILASLIAFSRLYVGVHYFSDILTGSILGLVVGHIGIALISKKKVGM
ncbi:MAG: phosphatase PAP2 family protein [Bacilli bacterium]